MISPSDGKTDENVKIINDINSTFLFKDKGYDAGEDRAGTLFVTVPVEAQTIQNTHLSEMAWRVLVSLHMPGMLR
jgi:hypothetical protein